MEEFSSDGSSAPSDSTRTTRSLLSTLLISIFSCLFSIGCCYFALFSVSFRRGLLRSANQIVDIASTCLKPIPSKYTLSNTCLLPCKSTIPSSTAHWANAIIFTLESQYRNQGISMSYLNDNEYILFSEDQLVKSISAYMNVSPAYITEHLGESLPQFNDSIVIGAPENIYFFIYSNPFLSTDIMSNGKTNKILKFESTDFSFNQTTFPITASDSDSISSNPLEYNLTGAQRIVGIETIKRRLISSSRPLPVSFNIPYQLFYKQIDSDLTESSEPPRRNEKVTPCPFNHNLTCYKYVLYPESSIIYNANFLNDQPYITQDDINTIKNATVMDIIGYNDNFIVHVNSSYFMKGGFIMRSESLNNEHSREFLMNEITSYQESQLCGIDSDPFNWVISSSLNCINQTRNAAVCNEVEFECLDDRICNKSLKYLFNGKNRFITYSNEAEPKIIELDCPVQYLNRFIRPKKYQKRKVRNQFCGYSFIPYEVVEDLYLHNVGPFSFDAVDLQIKWEDQSFYFHRTSSKKYIQLKQSTYEIESDINQYSFIREL